MAKKYISKIVKGDQTLDIKDAEAREAIASLPSSTYASTSTCEDIITELT